MYLKLYKDIIIDTNFIIKVSKGGIFATEEKPFVIFLEDGFDIPITENQYKKIINLLKPMELD